MTSPEALNQFKRQAIEKKLEEPALFRALLELDMPLDVTVQDSAEPPASMLAGSEPFYARSWGGRLASAVGGTGVAPVQ